MPSITLNRIRKTYGAATPVVPGLDLEVDDGEFLVLLGPSGCGKSTILRMIAGLIELDGGSIRFGDRDVSGDDPRRRNVAFVFQSYALYPNLTVERNISFPLVMSRFRWYHYIPGVNLLAIRHFSRHPEVAARVDAVCESLGLQALRTRRPKDLSGGQRQRAALARALVRDPEVFLLDEPLSNLDAQLRVQIRAEIVALHRRLGKTFVYVTHDQVEAMTMGTKVVVLDHGVVQQVGTPQEVYDRPANLFVARFIGSPQINILAPETVGTAESDPVLYGVRPSAVGLSREPAAGAVPAIVTSVEDLGAEYSYGFTLDHDPDGTTYHAVSHADARLFPGDAVHARFDLGAALRFDPASGSLLARH